jgi:long-chain acyl-CoA synthetase
LTATSPYGARPWQSQYGRLPLEISDLPGPDALALASRSLLARGDAPFLHYFETPLSGHAIDASSAAFGSALVAAGLCAGDRIVLQLQNVPQFIIALIGVWKMGGIVVPASPMYLSRELGLVVRDSGARALVQMDDLRAVGADAIVDSDVLLHVTTSPLEFLDQPLPQLLNDVERADVGSAVDFVHLLEAHRGERPPARVFDGDDVAYLVYTSGTTGPPKGAMNLHRNVVFNSTVWARWLGVTRCDTIMGLPPLFHITGLLVSFGMSTASDAPAVYSYRFDPAESLRLIGHHRPTSAVAAITAYTALMNDPTFPTTPTSSLTKAYTGGAPVPPAIADRWEAATGNPLRNCYGLTESTSAAILVPPEAPARVDPGSGALSVGVPVWQTEVVVLDESGAPVPVGEVGEIAIAGPQVVAGYWQQPGETAHAIRDGSLRTGDVGFMDDDGWFYLVDRAKDMIVASGYKIWPREVEDVLAEHDAVREAAVVGVPDAYRGETVKAFVSLRSGAAVEPADLIAFCRERIAPFKCPRDVEIVDELQKTASGKILRRVLRDLAGTAGT